MSTLTSLAQLIYVKPVHDHFVRLSLITGLSSRKCFLYRTVTALAAACPNLRTLSLAGCLELCPHETLPALLSKLPQLERLDLGHCTQFHPVRTTARRRAGCCKPLAHMWLRPVAVELSIVD